MNKHKYNLYPKITGSQYEELKKSISNGYDNSFPIIVYQDCILDGWNRYLVCKELNIIPPLKNFEGNDVEAIQYVIRTNNRRDLTALQRGALATEYLPLFESEANKRMLSGLKSDPMAILPQGASRDQAANMFGISGRTVQTAKKIKGGTKYEFCN